MSLTEFRQVLDRASLEQMEHVINWIERPWEPGRNDRLRAAWHQARREPTARGALIGAIEAEVLEMRFADLQHVARALGGRSPNPSVHDVLRLVASRIEPPPVRLDAIAAPIVQAAARILEIAVGEGLARPHRPWRRRRHGRG